MTETMKTIKRVAENQGISQANISRRTGFTSATIYRWFSGEREPTIKNVEKLANALDLRVIVCFR